MKLFEVTFRSSACPS